MLPAPSHSIDLKIRDCHAPLTPTSFGVITELCHRIDEKSFSTRLRVKLAPMFGGQSIGSIEIQVATTRTAAASLGVLTDTARTYALSAGAVDAVDQAARGLSAALALLGVDAQVKESDQLGLNLRAVQDTADMPDMDSDAASPFNPYNWRGIPGEEAQRWATLGFPAAAADDWRQQSFAPEDADVWFPGFELEDAIAWRSVGQLPMEADEWRSDGFTPSDAAAWLECGFDFENAATVKASGTDLQHIRDLSWQGVDAEMFIEFHEQLSAAEMVAWARAIEDHDLIDTSDIKFFIDNGLTSAIVEGSPDLTATKIVAYEAGLLDQTDLDEFDDLDELEDAESELGSIDEVSRFHEHNDYY